MRNWKGSFSAEMAYTYDLRVQGTTQAYIGIDAFYEKERYVKHFMDSEGKFNVRGGRHSRAYLKHRNFILILYWSSKGSIMSDYFFIFLAGLSITEFGFVRHRISLLDLGIRCCWVPSIRKPRSTLILGI